MRGRETRPGRRTPARRTDFRLLLSAVLVSQAGDWLYYVAFMVFLYDRTGSAAAVGAWMVARQLAYILVGPFATGLSERFDRRRWLLGINMAKLIVMGSMALLVALDGPVPLAIALAFVSSSLTSGYVPVLFAAVPDVVSEADLAGANALMASMEKGAMIGGPLLGAAVLALTDEPAIAIAINAASFALAAFALARLAPMPPLPQDPDVAPAPLHEQLTVGFRALRASHEASVIMVLSVASLLVFGFEQVVYVLISTERLGTGSNGVTAMIAAYGIGGVLGSSLAARLAVLPQRVPIMAAAFLVAQMPLALLAFVHEPAIAYVILGIGGAAFIVFEVVAVTVLQRAVPPRQLARVWALLVSLGCMGTLVGSLLGPLLADHIGLHATLLVPATLGLVTVAVMSRSLVALDRVASAQARATRGLAEILAAVPIFEHAPRAVQERLALALTEVNLEPGTVPIRQGDDPDHFYLVRSGAFDVHVDDGGGNRLVNTMGAGDWFGEIGLVHRRPRTATVTVTAPATVWRIPGEDFLEALETGSTLPGPLHAGIGQRLARTHPHEPAASQASDQEGSA